MNITFNELRDIKHRLPTGSISKIAAELGLEEQTVRNYFGAEKTADGRLNGKHIEQGPEGGIVRLPGTNILEAAQRILNSEGINALS